jgi:hypothetical protein
MQRSGGVLHSAAGARWDAKMDGMCVKVAGAWARGAAARVRAPR